MTTETRERRLLQTFATLADTLVDDYDVVELLQLLVDTCHEVLEVSAAGILLADPQGYLEVIASSSESDPFIELLQTAAEAGPALESFRTGAVVHVRDISSAGPGWDGFGELAQALGFNAAVSLPLRLREQIIGSLVLLHEQMGDLDDEDVLVARAFADVATIGILHERSLRESEALSTQLQSALRSRVIIEQAKGVVAHTRGVPVADAFTLIRQYARSHNLRLSHVASALVDRRLSLEE